MLPTIQYSRAFAVRQILRLKILRLFRRRSQADFVVVSLAFRDGLRCAFRQELVEHRRAIIGAAAVQRMRW